MSKCEKCIYRGNGGPLGRRICEYILLTGKPRGCDPGEGCDKFVPGDPLGAGKKNYGNIQMTRRGKMGKIDKTQLARMIADGKTSKECAKEFGCSESAVLQMRTKPEVKEMVRKLSDPVEAESVSEAESVLCRTPEEKPATKTVAECLAEEEEEERRKREAVGAEACDPFGLDEAIELPIPPISRAEWEESRRLDLVRAICEFAVKGLEIDPAWIAEYNERVAR